jgi:hypothetical protein
MLHMNIALKLNVAPWYESKALKPFHKIYKSSIRSSKYILTFPKVIDSLSRIIKANLMKYLLVTNQGGRL